MDHDAAERLISERVDGERLSTRATAALEHHLDGCAECRAFERGAWRLREAVRFEVAPAVPDLIEPIMAKVQAEAGARPASLRVVRDRPVHRRSLLPRLAPAIAALLVGVLIGSVVVGGPWRDRETGGPSAIAAADVTREVAAAASTLHAYQARFAITEHHLSDEVAVRELSMHVWFEAPERFRLDVVDHTVYASRTTPTDLQLIVNGSSWYSARPAPCPSAMCPPRELLVRNRAPFSPSWSAPTDLVLPLTTFAADDGVVVLGRGEILGRSAVQLELPFERARPLFPFLTLGGEWRPFFSNDRVRVWLDERNWFPLRWEVFPAGGHERDAWALRFGLPDEPSRRAIFEVDALSVDLATPSEDVFSVPETGRAQDQLALEVGLADVPRAAGFEPLAPADVAGLDLYRVVLPPAHDSETLITYADGLSFLKVGETRSWSDDALFGPVGPHSEEVSLDGGGIAYYEPSTADQGRRVSIHAAGTDLYLESNLSRDQLLAVAASLPVTGLGLPESWRVRETADGTTRRVTLEEGVEEVAFAIDPPAELPSGFALASVELASVGDATGVTLYFQDRDADVGIGPVRLHLESAEELPPATAATQAAVDVAGVEGRWTPERTQLEWVVGGVYRSLDAPGLTLEALLAIAGSIPDGDPPA